MSDESLLTIGQLARLTGVPATTLRYYEKVGLLTPTTRVSGQRRYDHAAIRRLMVVKFCSFAGMSLDDISMVVSDVGPDRHRTRKLALHHAHRIEGDIATLQLARDMMLASSRCHCHSPEQCTCGAMEPVILRLREHLQRTQGPPPAADYIEVVGDTPAP